MIKIRIVADCPDRAEELLSNLNTWQRLGVYSILEISKDDLVIELKVNAAQIIKVLRCEDFKIEFGRIVYEKFAKAKLEDAESNKFLIRTTNQGEVESFIAVLSIHKYHNELSDEDLHLFPSCCTNKTKKVHFRTTSQEFLDLVQEKGYNLFCKKIKWHKI